MIHQIKYCIEVYRKKDPGAERTHTQRRKEKLITRKNKILTLYIFFFGSDAIRESIRIIKEESL